jgi:hypothetical protein
MDTNEPETVRGPALGSPPADRGTILGGPPVLQARG